MLLIQPFSGLNCGVPNAAKATSLHDRFADSSRSSRGVDRHIRVESLTDGGDGGKGRADLKRDTGEDQLLAARRLDRASHASVVEGVDRRPINDLDANRLMRASNNEEWKI